jgi:thymidylate kinase
VFDRYLLDAGVPSGRALGRLARVSRRVQGAACPLPDLVLVLDASGPTLHRRSGEYDAGRLETWRGAYARIARAHPDRLETLDAEQPAAAVLREAKLRVWDRYRARWTRPDAA